MNSLECISINNQECKARSNIYYFRSGITFLIIEYYSEIQNLDKNFSYQPHPCNGFHDLMQKAISFDDVAIVSIKGNDYRVHFWYMSKDDAISIMHNSNWIDKKAHCNFFTYKKVSGATYYERNRDVILNREKDYYENNKELLRERAKNKYRELPKNEKDVKRQYQRDRYHNMTAEEKQRLKEYQRGYREARRAR